MVHCAVKSCKNSSAKTIKKIDGLTFHMFPKALERKRNWVYALNRSGDWMPIKTTRVCSHHFTQDCFYTTQKGFIKLHTHSVPSLLIEQPATEPNPSACEIPDEPHDEVEETPREKKFRLEARKWKTLFIERRKQLKSLKASRRRHLEKIAHLEAILKYVTEVNEKINVNS